MGIILLTNELVNVMQIGKGFLMMCCSLYGSILSEVSLCYNFNLEMAPFALENLTVLERTGEKATVALIFLHGASE